MTRLTIPAPNPVLTFIRVIENGEDITSTVSITHEFAPRRVTLTSDIPVTGFIEIM